MDIGAIANKVKNISGLQGAYENRIPSNKTELPCIVVRQYDGDVNYDMQGIAGVDSTFVELKVYGKNPAQCKTVTKAVRDILDDFTGTLSDGTVVQGCFHRGQSDDPYLTNIDGKDNAIRTLVRYEVIHKV